MSSEQLLRDDLRGIISNYRQQRRRNQAHEATTAELIAVACVMSKQPLSQAGVLPWINPRWSEFVSFITRLFYDYPERCVTLRALLDEAKQDYVARDIPAHETEERGLDSRISPTNLAETFLRRCISSDTTTTLQTHFRIMDLPAELRTRIFEFALMLPHTGVWYDFKTKHASDDGLIRTYATAWTAQRAPSTPFLPGIWDTTGSTSWRVPSGLFCVRQTTHLALLRVSRQVHKEALPCYYSRNVFYLPNDYAALSFLDNMPATQLSHVENIAWRWARLFALQYSSYKNWPTCRDFGP